MNFIYPRESLEGTKHTFWEYHTFSTPCSNKVLKVQWSSSFLSSCSGSSRNLLHIWNPHISRFTKETHFMCRISVCTHSKRLCTFIFFSWVSCMYECRNIHLKCTSRSKMHKGSWKRSHWVKNFVNSAVPITKEFVLLLGKIIRAFVQEIFNAAYNAKKV